MISNRHRQTDRARDGRGGHPWTSTRDSLYSNETRTCDDENYHGILRHVQYSSVNPGNHHYAAFAVTTTATPRATSLWPGTTESTARNMSTAGSRAVTPKLRTKMTLRSQRDDFLSHRLVLSQVIRLLASSPMKGAPPRPCIASASRLNSPRRVPEGTSVRTILLSQLTALGICSI